MGKIKEILEINDELNLYLVNNNIKPSSIISLNCSSPLLDTRIKRIEELKKNIRYVTLNINPQVIDELKRYLDTSKTEYKDSRQENNSEYYDTRNKIMHETSYDHMFYIGSNKDNLDKLLTAKNDREIGLALGYPIKSVDAYQKRINGEKRNGSYVLVSLAKAKQAGIDLPTWLSYISFVPEDLDFIHGKIALQAKQQGEFYKNFVSRNNPDLAKRVEEHFLNKRLPLNWKILPKGRYSLYY